MSDDRLPIENGDREAVGRDERTGAASDAVVVYATFPGEAEAAATAEALVVAGLVACANILPGIISVFIWEGRLEREREVVVLMKTRRALADEVIAAVKGMHPYENPAVVAWALVAGSKDYLGWIGGQTARPKPTVDPATDPSGLSGIEPRLG